MSVPGKDLLAQIENEHPKLGIYLRSYLLPSIQKRGLPNHVLATPTDKVGNAELTPLSSVVSTAGVNQIVAGTNVTVSPPGGTGIVTISSGAGSAVTQIVAGANVTISPVSGVGVVTINASGGGGGGSVFVDDETVAGSGTAWSLVGVPTPAGSLFLVQMLPGFGSIVLIEGTDYTLAGANITTVNSLSAGVLRAWYRTSTSGTNFADDETVGGSGTSWTLANAPNPPGSLVLVQYLPAFGGVTLILGTDYTLAGSIITTVNTISAGALTAWYRY